MEGKTLFEKLKESGYNLPEEFALFPPVILDAISTDWLLQTGNDLLAQYNFLTLAQAPMDTPLPGYRHHTLGRTERN